MLLVGTNAETSPAEWLGWSRTETPRVEILFLLKRSLHLKRINLLYWRDSSNGVGAPANVTIIDDNDVTHSFTQTDLCEAGEGVKWLSFIQEFTALTSYVKLQLEYGAGVDVMLLSGGGADRDAMSMWSLRGLRSDRVVPLPRSLSLDPPMTATAGAERASGSLLDVYASYPEVRGVSVLRKNDEEGRGESVPCSPNHEGVRRVEEGETSYETGIVSDVLSYPSRLVRVYTDHISQERGVTFLCVSLRCYEHQQECQCVQ